MNTEAAMAYGNESRDTQSEPSSSDSCVYVYPELQTLAIEHQPHVSRRVCLLLVLLAAVVILVLAVLLAVFISVMIYQKPSQPAVSSLSTTGTHSTTLLSIAFNVSTTSGSFVRTTMGSTAGGQGVRPPPRFWKNLFQYIPPDFGGFL